VTKAQTTVTLDREERKMSLGIKQLKQDPWETIEEKYPVGSKHTRIAYAAPRQVSDVDQSVYATQVDEYTIRCDILNGSYVFVGKTMEFKVVKINQEFKNVVVSHKALIEAELEQLSCFRPKAIRFFSSSKSRITTFNF